MNRTTYELLEKYMLSCVDASAHDKEHIYRVLYNALEIARDEENVDYDILITACLLHDIGRKEQLADPSLCHAQVGGEKAYGFLRSNGFEEAFAAHVRDCIVSHRFRKANPPKTPEAKILFDADKLDVAGAIGIARTLQYQGQTDRPLYYLREDGTVSDGTEDSEESFFQEYKRKLEKIYDRFYTAKGKAMALKRQKTAVRIYEDLLGEVSEPYLTGREELKNFVK